MYTVEMRPRKHWGYYGSLVMCGANIGTLVGNFVGAIIRSALTYEQLESWGWRIVSRLLYCSYHRFAQKLTILFAPGLLDRNFEWFCCVVSPL